MVKILYVALACLLLPAIYAARMTAGNPAFTRRTLIGHIANPHSDIDYKRRMVYVTTGYHGDFFITLPPSYALDTIDPGEYVKITLAEPAPPFEGRSLGMVQASGLTNVPTVTGVVVSCKDTELVLKIPTPIPSEDGKEHTLCFTLTGESVFAHAIEIGEIVDVTYEQVGNERRMLLATGLAG